MKREIITIRKRITETATRREKKGEKERDTERKRQRDRESYRTDCKMAFAIKKLILIKICALYLLICKKHFFIHL